MQVVIANSSILVAIALMKRRKSVKKNASKEYLISAIATRIEELAITTCISCTFISMGARNRSGLVEMHLRNTKAHVQKSAK
jgi:hypothetical protein